MHARKRMQSSLLKKNLTQCLSSDCQRMLRRALTHSKLLASSQPPVNTSHLHSHKHPYSYTNLPTHAHTGRHSLQYFPLPKLPLNSSARVLLRLEGGYLGLITAVLLLMTDCVTRFHTHTHTTQHPLTHLQPTVSQGFLKLVLSSASTCILFRTRNYVLHLSGFWSDQ